MEELLKEGKNHILKEPKIEYGPSTQYGKCRDPSSPYRIKDNSSQPPRTREKMAYLSYVGICLTALSGPISKGLATLSGYIRV